MRDWNKVSALAALGCLAIAAVTFAIQIWPLPQLRVSQGYTSLMPLGGPKLIAVFIVMGFVFAGIAIYGAWRNPKTTLRVSSTPTPEAIAANEEKRLVKEVNRMTSAELRERMDDPEFVRRVDAIPKNKYRGMPQIPGEPERYADTFQERTITLSRDLRDFLKEVKPPEVAERTPSESVKDYFARLLKVRGPAIEKTHHGYERRFKDRAIDIYHEMREHNLSDERFTELVASDTHNAADIQEIVERLWALAGKLEEEI